MKRHLFAAAAGIILVASTSLSYVAGKRGADRWWQAQQLDGFPLRSCRIVIPAGMSLAAGKDGTAFRVRGETDSVVAVDCFFDGQEGTISGPPVSASDSRAQFYVSEKVGEPDLLRTVREPGRTRTSNPLIKNQLLDH